MDIWISYPPFDRMAQCPFCGLIAAHWVTASIEDGVLRIRCYRLKK